MICFGIVILFRTSPWVVGSIGEVEGGHGFMGDFGGLWLILGSREWPWMIAAGLRGKTGDAERRCRNQLAKYGEVEALWHKMWRKGILDSLSWFLPTPTTLRHPWTRLTISPGLVTHRASILLITWHWFKVHFLDLSQNNQILCHYMRFEM
jgi:hypothetical protein